jgi:hypothetical protein
MSHGLSRLGDRREFRRDLATNQEGGAVAPNAGRPHVGIDAELGSDLATAALSLARRVHDGATLWCLAPAWPEHARHVAVEFVHPVIVGKRALPAVAAAVQPPIDTVRHVPDEIRRP